jgi:hypothetical protein
MKLKFSALIFFVLMLGCGVIFDHVFAASYVVEDLESDSLPLEVKSKLEGFPKDKYSHFKAGSFMVHSGKKVYIFISAGTTRRLGKVQIDRVDINGMIMLPVLYLRAY